MGSRVGIIWGFLPHLKHATRIVGACIPNVVELGLAFVNSDDGSIGFPF